MKKLIQKIYWYLTDKCTHCGGDMESWDNYVSFNCHDCGRSDRGWPMREESKTIQYRKGDRVSYRGETFIIIDSGFTRS